MARARIRRMMCFMLSEKTFKPRAGDKDKLKKKNIVSFR